MDLVRVLEKRHPYVTTDFTTGTREAGRTEEALQAPGSC